ncbi:hypothetical protein MBR110_29800 (plasmid) [Burkholderia sp. MBR-1]|nr:hypothetical protein MBR110_29800 [Burkholderia sp. MBR-1]
MAITKGNAGARSAYFEYSSTPGLLIQSNEANRALLIEARQLVGEDNWKKGFDGFGPKSNATKVRKFLAENDVPTKLSLSGELVSVYYSERDHQTGKHQDVRFKIVDKEAGESYLVTLPIESTAGQALIRKFANDSVVPGVVISAFSVFPTGPRKVDDREYFDHAVQLKGATEEIKQAEGLFEAAIEAASAQVEVLKNARVTDKEIINKARRGTMRDFYVDILRTKIEPRFADDSKEQHDDTPTGKPVTEPAGGDDGDPF